MELPKVTLTDIKLDKTTPTGSIAPSNSIVDTPTIMLALNANDNVSGIAQMRFSNGDSGWSSWEPYTTSKMWTLQNGDGTKTVNVQYVDNAGLTSRYSCTVTLETPKPLLDSLTTTVPTLTPTPTASPITALSPSPSSSPTPQAPELNVEIVLIFLAALAFMSALIFKKSRK